MPYVGAPFVAEGSPEGYLAAIDQVLELQPQRLIHGHPPLSALFTVAAMPGLRDAVRELYQHTLAAAHSSRPLADVLEDDLLPAALRDAPAAVQPYLVMRDTFIQRTYAEHAGYWQVNGDGMDHFTRAQWAAALDAFGATVSLHHLFRVRGSRTRAGVVSGPGSGFALTLRTTIRCPWFRRDGRDDARWK